MYKDAKYMIYCRQFAFMNMMILIRLKMDLNEQLKSMANTLPNSDCI